MSSTPAFMLYKDVAHAPIKWPVIPKLPVTYALIKSAVISGSVNDICFEDARFPSG